MSQKQKINEPGITEKSFKQKIICGIIALTLLSVVSLFFLTAVNTRTESEISRLKAVNSSCYLVPLIGGVECRLNSPTFCNNLTPAETKACADRYYQFISNTSKSLIIKNWISYFLLYFIALGIYYSSKLFAIMMVGQKPNSSNT